MSTLAATPPLLLRPQTILVVDDSPDVAHVLSVWLEHDHRRVFCAHSGREAAAILERQAIDAVVTDILMPDGDGIELLTALRLRQPRLRLVAMSGGGRYLEAPNCLQLAHAAGAQVCLQKPFTHVELFAALDGTAA
jgi:CheY-like chemotaxis protein